MEKIFVARRVAGKLFATENAVDAALLEATEMMADMLRARKELNLSVVAGDSIVTKVAAAIAALSEARTAMVDAHADLDEMRLRLGIRTKLSGPEDKVEEDATPANLRNVA